MFVVVILLVYLNNLEAEIGRENVDNVKVLYSMANSETEKVSKLSGILSKTKLLQQVHKLKHLAGEPRKFEENLDVLKGLYSSLKQYPDLMERRLTIGGKKPPKHQPKTDIDGFEQDVNKRSHFDIGVAQPACPFKTNWVRLYHARDINNTEVEVFQPRGDSNKYQWFYTVTCDYESIMEENSGCPFCCRAINHRRYVSRCVPRKSYVMALMRHSPANDYDWGYIQVDSSCNCAISEKV